MQTGRPANGTLFAFDDEVVLVQTPDRADDARAILERHGARLRPNAPAIPAPA
jgi:hypothetical protein